MGLQEVTHAQAILKGTAGNKVDGVVSFQALNGGVRIIADIQGLTPGLHGFHIHEHGDCSTEDASSAGGHFNPTGHNHGSPDDLDRHVGDLGNLLADENGNAHFERVDNIIELNGEHSIVGRGLIVHAAEDDFTTQPTGNAGARVACGIIDAVPADQSTSAD